MSITILVLTLDYLQEELITKFIKKILKILFWDLFVQIWEKMNFSRKKGFVSL